MQCVSLRATPGFINNTRCNYFSSNEVCTAAAAHHNFIVMFLFPKPCVILVLNVIGSVLWLIELTDISRKTAFQDLGCKTRSTQAFKLKHAPTRAFRMLERCVEFYVCDFLCKRLLVPFDCYSFDDLEQVYSEQQ